MSMGFSAPSWIEVIASLLLAAAALAALATARLAGHALFDNAHRLVPLRETPGEAR
jgi:ABC-type iron transport system FetAB permease component